MNGPQGRLAAEVREKRYIPLYVRFRLSLPLPSGSVGRRNFMLFTKTPQIYSVIDEYAAWKLEVHPYQAGAHRALLIRFCKSHKLKDVEDITEEHIAYFVGGELTGYYAHAALKALRSFLWYARSAGYDCISHNCVSRVKKLIEHEIVKLPKSVPERKWIPGLVGKWNPRQS